MAFLQLKWVGRVAGRFNHGTSSTAGRMPACPDAPVYANHHTRIGEPDQVNWESHSPRVDGGRVGEEEPNTWCGLDAASGQPSEAGKVRIGDVHSQLDLGLEGSRGEDWAPPESHEHLHWRESEAGIRPREWFRLGGGPSPPAKAAVGCSTVVRLVPRHSSRLARGRLVRWRGIPRQAAVPGHGRFQAQTDPRRTF